MRFNTNIIARISSDSKVKILRHVLSPGFRMTGRELARICGVSHSMAIDTLKEFESINLVHYFKAGTSAVWVTNTKSYIYSVAKKIYGKKENYLPVEHLKKTIIKALPEKIIKKAVLFGSVSRGTEKTSSDIDLFVLVGTSAQKLKAEKILENLSLKCIELYGNNLGFYLLTENELAKRKNLPVIKNINKGIKLI